MKTKSQRIAIEEQAVIGSVDSDLHVLRGVKICGIESRNTARVLGLTESDYGDAVDRPYFYSPEALRNAIPHYEGVTVYSGHTPFEINSDGRRVFRATGHDNDAVIGWLENVRFVAGEGLFGDLHYLTSHPLGAILEEVCERKPNQFALSHEANFAEPRVIGGRVCICKITSVDGVALVNGKAGTTNGLFESYGPAPQKAPLYATKGSLVRAMNGVPEPSPRSAIGSLFRRVR